MRIGNIPQGIALAVGCYFFAVQQYLADLVPGIRGKGEGLIVAVISGAVTRP